MPEAAVAAAAFVAAAVILALGAVRVGMLLGGLVGRRLDRQDEEETRGPGG
jgi:hypothetical protein